MFSSVQIKQEYSGVEDRNLQNMPVGANEVVDCTVFDNQNTQYTYHQLPHLWDQALQTPYTKNSVQKSDNPGKMDSRAVNQQIPAVSASYLNQHLQLQQQLQQQQQQQQQQQHQHQHQQQQQQHQNNTFVINQQQLSNIQSSINQAVDSSNAESGTINSGLASAIITNGILMNPALAAAAQQNTAVIKRNTSNRGTKSNNASGTTKKPAKCQCEICFKEFGHKSNLFIHMRTHNGERPYKCKECDKSFTHSGNLAIHMRTHSGERPYACKVCGKMFSHSGNLSTHLRTHSGVKPFKCNICGKEFRHSGNLSIHERIHSGVKPFHCKVCGKQFYHSGNLSTHFKKHPVASTSEVHNDNVTPSLSGDYVCNSIDRSTETERILISNSSNLESTITNASESMTETENRRESKSS
ncbi:Krueppel homolog 1-like [Trichogramma pretiosum]|uniref:Krueppel homolog 1-like n=1 Tax=Trichogramma pretiosum TaxID=7493 RepID=UPI0006C983B1|nr:Krueppel homolog 1-like [Trichogramma pretiosum]XP_023317771.1 Krueppel homolog 1-like [Trichogramma pretiosum]